MNRYRTTLRPAGFATLPPGIAWKFVEAPQGERWNPRPDLPVSRYRYGVIETDRALTPEELRTFEIEQVTEPKLIMCNWCGKPHIQPAQSASEALANCCKVGAEP